MSRKQEILDYIFDELLDDDDEEIEDDSSLFQGRVLDSLQLLTLISFLEKTYAIKVGNAEINIENFDSISNIMAFLEKKTAS